MGRLGRLEERRIDNGQRDDHAHQLAAFDAALVGALSHLVATGMVLGCLLAVTVVHCRFGHGGAAGSQGRAHRGKAHCNCNEDGEKQPIHAFSCNLRPQAVKSRHCKP
jgi:hypothetical protein